MNRLELCRSAMQLAGIPSGSFLTTLNQTGEGARVVRWIDDAWQFLQQMHLWNFLWEQAAIVIPAGNHFIAGTIPATRYVPDSAWVGTRRMDDFVPWEEFRERWPVALVGNGEPSAWSIRPDNAFVVSARPLVDLTINVERYRNPTAMAADTDTPTGLPAEHHLAIVYQALLLYANFEEAGITRATAQEELNKLLGVLTKTQLPAMQFGGALC